MTIINFGNEMVQDYRRLKLLQWNKDSFYHFDFCMDINDIVLS